MTMIRPLTIALLGLSVPCAAHAENFGFKGVDIGSPVALIADNPKYECHAVRTPVADRVCSLRKDASETIAGAPVGTIFFFYDQAVLTGISIHLPEQHFKDVVSALTSKFGASAHTTELVKNYKGKPFENQIHTWSRPGQSMVAQRYSGRLDTSAVRISDDNAADRIKARRELIHSQPSRDL